MLINKRYENQSVVKFPNKDCFFWLAFDDVFDEVSCNNNNSCIVLSNLINTSTNESFFIISRINRLKISDFLQISL